MERFTIADVARIHDLEILDERGGETYCVCPFCGNRKKKFSYIIEKGNKKDMYKCFKCDAGGTAIDLHKNLSPSMEYEGEDGYKAVVRDIYRALNGDSGFIDFHREQINAVKRFVEADKKSDEECSSVYYALLNLLKLEDIHRNNLQKRGLSDEDIERFRFRSLPKDGRDVAKKLLEQGYELSGIPGFYKNKKGVWTFSVPGTMKDGKWIPDTGYFCPAFDGEKNHILGFQIRLDHPKDDAKYIWVSSAGREGGCSCGGISTYLPGKENEALIITEGILKALIIYCLLGKKISVIGVPGVNSIKSLSPYLSRMNGVHAFEAFDMDKAIKTEDMKEKEKTERIALAARKMSDLVMSYGISIEPLKWDFDKDGYWKGQEKGLDDFLVHYKGKSDLAAYFLAKAKAAREVEQFLKKCS